MLNWKVERAASDKNYCGYCSGGSPDTYCIGSCFILPDDLERQENKIDHIKSEIIITKKRLTDLLEELDKLKFIKNENRPE